MSQTYIPGIVNSIKSDSTPYSPIIEAITNSIDAIAKTERTDGRIDITVERKNVLPGTQGEELPDIISVTITDNGVGFNDDNLKSFDTIYSPQKKDIGGKGFGRFFFLRHFTSAGVESHYKDGKQTKKRTFDFGQEYDVVTNEKTEDVANHVTGTVLRLNNLRLGKFEKEPELFAHRVLEHLLSYFVDDTYKCPTIVIHDGELDKPIVLNDLIGDKDDSLIRLLDKGDFMVKEKQLNYKMFKLLKPRNQKGRIVLTARNQSVTDAFLETYVPEFATGFVENVKDDTGKESPRNYIVHFYIQSDYLDENVTTERDGFNFGDKPETMGLFPVSKEEIEREVAGIAKEKFGEEFRTRFEKKKQKIEDYATENVWYRPYVGDLDLEVIKANPSKDEMEAILHKVKYDKDLETKRKISELTSGQSTYQDAEQSAEAIIKEAKEASISDLAQYVAFRKAIIELLKNAIKLTQDGTYKTEKELHDIIFPTKKSSKDVAYDGHNLWVLDERLTFTQHVSSDQRIFKGKNGDRPDIAAFYYSVAYREANESYSPVSIFEFKKPGRSNFVSKSAEDPVDQIIRYVQAMKKGDLKTIDGLEIQVGDTTPFYGYVVADSDSDIRDWLVRKNFNPLPDGKGWFYNHGTLNLHIEYITWQKLISDAEVRHQKFFELLAAV